MVCLVCLWHVFSVVHSGMAYNHPAIIITTYCSYYMQTNPQSFLTCEYMKHWTSCSTETKFHSFGQTAVNSKPAICHGHLRSPWGWHWREGRVGRVGHQRQGVGGQWSKSLERGEDQWTLGMALEGGWAGWRIRGKGWEVGGASHREEWRISEV